MIGVALADLLDWPQADALASIAIGFILATVATFIAIEVKALLIGEAAHDNVQAGVRAIIADADRSNGHIVGINEIRTLQLGANDVLVPPASTFDDTTRAIHIKAATHRLETAIKEKFPEVTQFYIEVEAAEDHAAMGGSPNDHARVSAEQHAMENSPGINVKTRQRRARSKMSSSLGAMPVDVATPCRVHAKRYRDKVSDREQVDQAKAVPLIEFMDPKR